MSIIARALDGAPAPSTPRPPKRRKLCHAPLSTATPESVSLEELPGIVEAAVSTYLADPNPGRALLLALPAGAGKTTAMVGVAERVASGGRRVMYAAPRHDFYNDIRAISQRPGWWYEWQPRRLGTDTLETTCRWAPQMQGFLARGYQAPDFCRNPRICGFDYMTHDCPFLAQQRITHPIIFAQHAHVALRHPLMEQCELLIGDESPLSAFLSSWIIPTGGIVVADQPPDIEQLLYTLHMLCVDSAHQTDGPALLDELGGAAYVAELCERHAVIDMPESPGLRGPEDVETVDYCHLPILLSLLAQEARAALSGLPDWVRRVRTTRSGLALLRRRRPGPLPKHIIWCDATGSRAMYERLLGMPVTVVAPRVAMAGTVYQIHASLNNSTSILALKDASKESEVMDAARATRRRDKLQSIMHQVTQIVARGDYQKPAIISYKRLSPDLSAFGDVGHFGGERGTNRLEQCDALVVIGTPQPPHTSLIDDAAMLFDDRVAPFNTTWSERERCYDGQPHAWPMGGFWDDPDLQMILEQSRDAELIQAINRVRPLRRKVDVWLLTNCPLSGVPVTLMSLRELFEAPTGIDPYRWPEFRDWVRLRIDEAGIVATPHVAAHLGVQLAAARRYLEHVIDQDGYERCTAPGEGRGRPPLAARRRVD